MKLNANIFILGSHDWVLGAGPISGPKEAEYVLQRTWVLWSIEHGMLTH